MRNWILRRPRLALAVTFCGSVIGATALFLVYVWIAAWLWPEFFSPKGSLWSITKGGIAFGGGGLLFWLFPLVWMVNKLDDYIFAKEAIRKASIDNLPWLIEQMRREGKSEAEINEEINRIMFD